MRRLNSYIIILTAIALVRCSFNELTGGGSDLPDKVVTGKILTTDNIPAPNTQVALISADFNPVNDAPISAALLDTTDSSGDFRIERCGTGSYTIQAVHLSLRTRLLITGVTVTEDTTMVPADTLRVPGIAKAYLPDGINPADCWVYIPGTTIAARPIGPAGYAVLDSVPAGTIPSVCYGTGNDPVPAAVRRNFLVASGDTAVLAKPAWIYSRRLYLNTTASGAQVAENVLHFPVLVRLTGNNFDFSQAQPGGEDLRFTKADTTALPYEIERWDAAGRQAEIWVRLDTVYGNRSDRFFTMYWGNAPAASASDDAAVFDTARGFSGVWHLGQPAGTLVADATANGIHGTATATTTVSGAIGTAQAFDGMTSMIQAFGPASDKVNFPDTGMYSVSAWVKTSVLDSLCHAIVFKSNAQYGMQIIPEHDWEFVTYIDKTRWESTRSPALVDSWHAITGIRKGTRQYLYVDGVCTDSTIVDIPAIAPENGGRVYDLPLEIGHCPDGGRNPDRFFNGSIDEVRISKIAHSADWIKLCYMNQKEQDALVRW